MSKVKSGERQIIDALMTKACTKQSIYRTTLEVFGQFKTVLQQLQSRLSQTFDRIDKSVVIEYRELGGFESELKFGSDILYFSMHTNVFTFDKSHEIHKLKYIRDEPLRAYFGMITVYNFLADSIKYNRPFDLGYLIARVFINRDKHFFVDGERPLSFLYNDLAGMEISEAYIKSVIESTMLYALDFDLYVPPFRQVNLLSVQEKMQMSGSAALRTAKRLGFHLSEKESK
ncbi:MAG TPA: hypothetical protein VNJ07_05220 [Chitinophagales bacterium]|nr:hypothetical protein [Chitinophagales bacterium]